MGITLGQLQARLIGELDVIPAASTRERINDALREIYDEHEWGFLFEDGFIRTPELIEGFAQVAKFSPIVIVSQAITDKINAINEFDIDIFQKQFRSLHAREVDRGFTYKITDWDSTTNTLTIDPPYQDISNAAAKVQILQVYFKSPYYNPPYEKGVDPVPDPVIDFKRFEFVVSPYFQRKLIIDATRAELDRIDPYRQTIAEPRYFIPHIFNEFEEPLFEMYPAPRFARIFRTRYMRNGAELKHDSQLVPDIFTKELIINKAKISSYSWAKANADKLNLKTVGKFDNLIALAMNKHEKLLEEAIKKDEERFPKAYMGNFLDYPEYERELEYMGETLLINF